MEEASAAHPASAAAVGHLLERSAAYFQRYRSLAFATRVVSPLAAARYAMRAARRVNSLFEPDLVAVDFTEPNEFITEILGQATVGQISHHKNEDFKSLERITEDPPTEAKPLHHRSFLHAAQRARLAKARAARPEPPKPEPSPPSPAPPPPVPDEDTALAESWSQNLSDTRITLGRTNSPPGSGYGAGTPYCSRESFLDLHGGYRYRLLEIGFVSGVSYAGVEPSPTRKPQRI